MTNKMSSKKTIDDVPAEVNPNESRVRFWLGNAGRESERIYDKQRATVTYLRTPRRQGVVVDLRHGDWQPLAGVEVVEVGGGS